MKREYRIEFSTKRVDNMTGGEMIDVEQSTWMRSGSMVVMADSIEDAVWHVKYWLNDHNEVTAVYAD